MPRCWDAQAAAALDPAVTGPLRVLGGPGTGKTSLLVDIAAAHIAAGVDPRSVLVVTPARLDVRTRAALTSRLLGLGAGTAEVPAVIREPLVRTVHGYAFAVLRQAAARAGDPPPRLVTGAEQDAIVAELLCGDDPAAWPPTLHAALGTDGFVTELRDLLSRCAERGVTATRLAQLGRRFRRPEWTAAGRFAQQYEQVMLLRAAVGRAAPQATVPALGAAELVGAALDVFVAEPDLLAAEQHRIRLLLVDDAQQLDPQAARLVQVLAAGVARTVIAGDQTQAVFGFRGAEPTPLLDGDPVRPGAAPSPAVTLTLSHRCAPAVARAVVGVAGRLPSAGTVRGLRGTGADDGSVTVRLAGSGHAQATLIADTLRRAHLIDGVPWSQMAVIVRSPRRFGDGLPRALAAAGVPVALPSPVGSLSQHPAVAALLTVLTATADGLDHQRAVALLSGPIGRMDPVSLRQLRRVLGRGGPPGAAGFEARLVAALTGEVDALPAGHARPLRRVRAVLAAAARCQRDGKDPHHTLWQVWRRSGLQRRWLTMRDRGGPAGAQADRDLDAVTALFDLAEQYVARTAGTSLRGLVEHVRAMRLPPTSAGSALDTEAVQVLSAHRALGQEWDLVVIAGLQDGLWPNTAPRGGVLHTQALLDLLDGVAPGASARAVVLAEERRLLVAALGRARRRVVVTAVDSAAGGDTADDVPSRFVAELARYGTDGTDPAGPAVQPAPPVLSAAAVVGRLRAVVCAPPGAVDDSRRAGAARQLARLAHAGVPGADPADWHVLTPVSTDEPLWRPGPGPAVTLSPSSVQTLIDCPLRWLIEQHGGTDGRDLRAALGSVLHELIAGPATGASTLADQLARVWPQLPFEARWHADNELDRHRDMLASFAQWRDQTRDRLTEVGVEVGFEGVIDGTRVRGRIDRVERDAVGRLVVVDVKTGKTPVSKDEAQRHAQLALYQLAVDAGLIAADAQPGGGRLVYPAKPGAAGPAEREQDPLTAEQRDQWRSRLRDAAAATAGPRYAARVNDGCRHCPARSICPAQQDRTAR